MSVHFLNGKSCLHFGNRRIFNRKFIIIEKTGEFRGAFEICRITLTFEFITTIIKLLNSLYNIIKDEGVNLV